MALLGTEHPALHFFGCRHVTCVHAVALEAQRQLMEKDPGLLSRWVDCGEPIVVVKCPYATGASALHWPLSFPFLDAAT